MLHVTVYVTVAVRRHVTVAVSPYVMVHRRVCVSVSAQGYVSSPDSQA